MVAHRNLSVDVSMHRLIQFSVFAIIQGEEVLIDPFDLDRCLGTPASHLIECFYYRVLDHTFYDLVTRQQTCPVPVDFGAFLDVPARFSVRLSALGPIQCNLTENRIARLYPGSGLVAPYFKSFVLSTPPTPEDENSGEADPRV